MIWLSRLLPFLKPALDKLGKTFGADSRADELRAEAELIEAKAFAKGRIAPRYLWQYSIVLAFSVFLFWLIAWAIFPASIPSPLATMQDFFAVGAQALGLLFGSMTGGE